jgi:2-C-methyl-D-erythritol 4-phosphate cytidylyltransferase
MGKRGVVIVAGGSGRRMHSALPKQFMLLGGIPVVARTINIFAEALPGAEIVVVLPEEHIAMWKNLAARFDVAVHKCVAGGAERFHSVKAGIEALSEDVTSIAVHDGVRALVTKRLIIRAALAIEENDAVIPVIEVVDSYRRVEQGGSTILPRSELRIVQTPQIFKSSILRKAYTQEFDQAFTDDASVVEAMGIKITLVDGERTNIKLTTPEDMEWAEWMLQREEGDK